MDGMDGATRVVVAVDRVSARPRLDAVLAMIRRRGGMPAIIALELEVHDALVEAGYPSTWLGEVVDPAIHQAVDREAMELAHGWFREVAAEDGREIDLTEINGLSLGGLVAWELSYAFAEMLRCRRNVEALLDVDPAETVIVIAEPRLEGSLLMHSSENFHTDAFRAVCARRGRSCLIVGQEPSESSGSGPSIALVGTASNRSEGVPASAPRSTSRESADAGPSRRRDVLSVGVRSITADLLDALHTRGFASCHVLGDAGPLAARPDVGRVDLAGDAAAVHHSAAARAAEQLMQRRAESCRQACMRRVESICPELGDSRDLTLRIDRALRERLPAAYRQLLALRRYLRREPIGVVLLHDDVTETGRAVALAAAAEGVPSMVLLHGTVGHPIGALPVSADRVAVYGPHFRDWFGDRGVPAGRIVETGSPRMPALGQSDGHAVPTRRVGAAPCVVLALQHCNRATSFANVHWPVETWRQFVDVAADAVDRIDGARLQLRLHPSDERQSSWRRWIDQHPRRERIDLVSGGAALPSEARVLLTGWSTLGLEAVLAGIPLVTANFTGRPTPVAFGALGLSRHVERPEALAGALAEAWSHPSPVPWERLRHLLVAGGREAAERVADAACELAAGGAAAGRDVPELLRPPGCVI